LYCIDDAIIGAAPAKILIHAFDDLRPTEFGISEKQAIGFQDHARRAEATLDGPMLNERFLQRMEFSVIYQSFNGDDFLSGNVFD
jgi:hypothetical protein